MRSDELEDEADEGGAGGRSAVARPGLAAVGSAPLCANTLVDGKYRILSTIGEGGMGRVYEVRNERTGGCFALKLLGGQKLTDPRRLLREAEAGSRVEHPNVIKIFDLGLHAGAPYLVMERLRGQSLDELLLKEGPLEPAHAVAWLAPVIHGVEALHAAGVVHRDIKPANLFVVQPPGWERYLKLLDFGVAQLLNSQTAATVDPVRLTASGAIVGTPMYMAPEQLWGADVDPRADIYALATVLFEMIVGEAPHPAENLTQLVAQIASEDPTDLRTRLERQIPSIGAVLATALARDVDQRFESAALFREQLLSRMAASSAASVLHSGHAASTLSPPTLSAPTLSPPTLHPQRVAAGSEPQFVPSRADSPTVLASRTLSSTPALHVSRARSKRGLALAMFLLTALLAGVGWRALRAPASSKAAPEREHSAVSPGPEAAGDGAGGLPSAASGSEAPATTASSSVAQPSAATLPELSPRAVSTAKDQQPGPSAAVPPPTRTGSIGTTTPHSSMQRSATSRTEGSAEQRPTQEKMRESDL